MYLGLKTHSLACVCFTSTWMDSQDVHVMHGVGEKRSGQPVAPVRTLSVRVSRMEASRSMSLLAGPLSCMLFWRLLRREM